MRVAAPEAGTNFMALPNEAASEKVSSNRGRSSFDRRVIPSSTVQGRRSFTWEKPLLKVSIWERTFSTVIPLSLICFISWSFNTGSVILSLLLNKPWEDPQYGRSMQNRWTPQRFASKVTGKINP